MNESCPMIGIDVSKDTLELAYHGQPNTQRFTNDAQGLAALIDEVSPHQPACLVVEATGGYERPLAQALHEADLPIATVNPRPMRDFAKSWGYLVKNDKIDARLIARFAAERKPRPDEKPDENRQHRADLASRRQQLIKMRTAEKNRLQQAINHGVARSIQQVIEALDQQINELEKQIQKLIEQDQRVSQQKQTLMAVQGVGEQTARTLLSELPELGRCSRKQIASLVGLAPFDNDSGKFKGKRKIRGGRASVRNMLYMATLTAKRVNPVIRNFFNQLTEKGKPFKVAMTACMRKLLHHLNRLLAQPQTTENFANTT